MVELSCRPGLLNELEARYSAANATFAAMTADF